MFLTIILKKKPGFSTVGLVFNTQLIFTFIKEMGIGVELYGNINSVRSIAEIKLYFSFKTTENLFINKFGNLNKKGLYKTIYANKHC
jgi:hypothetical protein